MHGAPFGEIARHSAPGAASALQIENGTRHRTNPLCAVLCVYGYFPKEGGGGQLCTAYVTWVGFSVHAIVYNRDYEHVLTALLRRQIPMPLVPQWERSRIQGRRLPQMSMLALLALSSMKARRGSTSSPIRVVKISSASRASLSWTCSMRRTAGSSVVSHSWSGFISPRPL